MRSPRLAVGWLVLAACVPWEAPARAQLPADDFRPVAAEPSAFTVPAPLAPTLPFDQLPAAVRDQVRRITGQPTLSARAPAEEFNGRPALYQWLLDHPDRAAQAWRRLGTPALEIADRGNGCFGWADAQGSDLHWETIYRSPQMRVWYAEGRARPGLLLPLTSVRAVVVLHHSEVADAAGRPCLRHQADLYLHTDNKTAALLARLLGPSVPRLTEQCVSQLQMFFSALTGYLDRHPERTEALLGSERAPS